MEPEPAFMVDRSMLPPLYQTHERDSAPSDEADQALLIMGDR